MNPAQWSGHTCIAWDWIWKLHIKMVAALSSGHLGAGSQERLKAATWHRGNSAHSSLRWTVLCSAAVQKGTEGNRSHPEVYIDFVSKGLWTPSDVSRCTMSDQEGSPAPAYKIPFAQGGRTWHKFIAETRCTSLPPSWLIKVVMRSKSSLQIQ